MYRTRKFVRRHKLPVLAAAAVLVALVGGMVATSWEAAIAHRERTEALHQKTDAVAARALAEQRSRETIAERNRAEEQTALAVRQEEVAERQRTVAEARLSDVHALADSMLFEINDDVKDLPGGTKAREALVRLGQQYLNKETAATQNDPQRRQELAEAFVKVGDLQGAPGQSNLRDIAGARESYGRSAAMLEGEVKARPHDPKIRHLLTLAYVRRAALEETRSAKDAGFERAQESAEDYAAQWPTDPQGLRDQAEVKLARGKRSDAVKLRERILAGNPKDPVLRGELAQAQLAYGSYLVGKDNQQALELLQKVADLCEALSKEEPANVQYQRDRAVALSHMSGSLKSLDRVDEAVTRAGQSVSILEQLTASDRRNASFRLDLSAARLALAEAHYEKGQIAKASENIAAAASIQEEQAALNPDNPDFPRQAAIYYRTLGIYKTAMKEYKAAMEAYRKAEALDRKLVARYPRRLEFAEELRSNVHYIGDTFQHLGDKASALDAYRDALRTAKAAETAQPTEESLWGLGIAHHGVANGLANMSRWEEAIAEEREFVAIFERRAALDPADRLLKRSLCTAYGELSLYYDARGDTKSAIAASEKALPFLEADYAAHRDDGTAESALWSALFYLRNQYTRVADYDRGIAAARRCVEIAEHSTSANRDEYSRNRHLAASLINLQGTLHRSGRGEESLAICRRAASVLDLHPIEQEMSPVRRYETADSYLYLVEDFNGLRRQEEGAVLCKRVLPVLEALRHDSPDNNRYRDALLRAYHLASPVFLNLGDLAGALDVENKALKLEPPANSPAEQGSRALRIAHAGSLELRLGHRDVALKIWREALALFQRAAAESEKLWSSDSKDLSALETLRWSEGWAGFILEELGDFPQSVSSRKSSYTRALALLKSDRGTPANREHYRVGQAHIVRDLSLLEGDHADYRPYFENGNPTREEIRAVLAFAWRYRAAVMYTAGSPIPPRLEAAQKAVALSRQLMADNPSVANRVLLSESLKEEGDVFIALARYSKGTEMTSAYQASRDRYAESLGILNSLKAAGKLPDEEKAELVTVTNHLAEADERVKDATLSTKAKQP